MGADISTIVEARDTEGIWRIVSAEQEHQVGVRTEDDFPFGVRSYAVYGFLGDVQNTACCPVIASGRGLPNDSAYLRESANDLWCEKWSIADSIIEDGNNYGYSFVTVAELLAFDYEQQFENLRLGNVYKSADGNVVRYSGNKQGKPGEGEVMSMREHLGEHYFDELNKLRQLGEPENVRVIFWFN